MQFFLELLNCNYELCYWKYDAEYHLMETTWKNDLFSGEFFAYVGMEKILRERQEQGKLYPVVLEAGNNLLWIAGFEHKEEQVEQVYYIGPIYSGRDSMLILRKKLDSYNLSVPLRSRLFRVFEEIPIVPGNILTQYAVMFEYAMNENRIEAHEIEIVNILPEMEQEIQLGGSEKHSGIWEAEQNLCRMLKVSSMMSAGMKVDYGDTLRRHKNNTLVLLTICSRASMRGGLSPEIAYNLNDYYAQKIEECKSMTDTTKVCQKLLEDYVGRVRESRENPNVSDCIRNSCEYIKGHLSEVISVKKLAEQSGYTEYYFSRKFKKETGVSVNEYVLHEKIERAKTMLTGSTASIQSISDSLAFGNRSYFYSCFQKEVGSSPSEYRRKKVENKRRI